jgi:hypothetical protein
MRRKHNTLLASVAALALLAGGGIAAAQQSPQGQTKAGAGVSAQGAAQAPSGKQGAATGMEQHAQTGSPSGSAAAPGAKTTPSMAQKGADNAKSENRSAQIGQNKGENAKSAQTNESKQRLGENAKQNTKENTKQTAKTESKTENKSGERIGTAEKNGHERMGANTRSEREHTRTSERSKRKDELKGLQGNTSLPMQGSHVKLTSGQRTHLRDSVIDARGAPRVGHVDFDVTVGTLVPRDRVHVVRVPETLARIDPRWHGYLYFVVADQVVIVNPRDMRIVAVLEV